MKKILVLIISSLLLTCELIQPLDVHASSEILSSETYISDGSTIEITNYNDYQIITLEDDQCSLVYDSRTNIVYNQNTGELVAEFGDIEVIPVPAIFENIRDTSADLLSYTYMGVTIADRWVYSYSTRQSVKVYNATITLLVNTFKLAATKNSLKAAATTVLESIATNIILASLTIHGNSYTTAHYYDVVRRYANKNVLSDFANMIVEEDENNTTQGVTSYSSRLSANIG